MRPVRFTGHPGKERKMNTGGFDLSALLSEALAKASRPKATPAEIWREELRFNYNLTHYEAHVWRSKCLCCGTLTMGLEGVYEAKQHTRIASQRVLHRLDHNDLVPGTDTMVLVKDETQVTCLHCVESLGFDLQEVPEIELATGPGDGEEEDEDAEAEEEEDEDEDFFDEDVPEDAIHTAAALADGFEAD
jgi:hypothetical protein